MSPDKDLLADDPPLVVEILYALYGYDTLSNDSKHQLRSDVRQILDAWEAHEDRDELLDVLGLRFHKNRRKELSVDLEWAMAMSYANLKRRRVTKAAEQVGDQFARDKRTVLRAYDRWKSHIEPLLDGKSNPDTQELFRETLLRQRYRG